MASYSSNVSITDCFFTWKLTYTNGLAYDGSIFVFYSSSDYLYISSSNYFIAGSYSFTNTLSSSYYPDKT